jgi:hypothetical protein
MIVWDSRTIHCNSPAIFPLLEESLIKNELLPPAPSVLSSIQLNNDQVPSLLRIAAYICMTPSSKCESIEIIKKR